MVQVSKTKLILGSSSPFRKQILQDAGFVFGVKTADIDEKAIRNKDFKKLVLDLGLAKLDAILKKNKFEPNTIILTSDLVVSHNGKLREKPVSKKEVISWHRGYHKGDTKVYCSVVAHHVGLNKTLKTVDVASLKWNKIPERMIQNIADNPVTYKGAGFTAQAFFHYAKSINGSVSTIQGMPIRIVEGFLEKLRYYK